MAKKQTRADDDEATRRILDELSGTASRALDMLNDNIAARAAATDTRRRAYRSTLSAAGRKLSAADRELLHAGDAESDTAQRDRARRVATHRSVAGDLLADLRALTDSVGPSRP